MGQMKPYNPFFELPQSKLSSEIRVRSTHSNKVSINEYILHKSIGKGSYAQVRAGYDLIAEQPVALRVINRKNLARKIGLQKTDQMIANSSKIHLMLKKSIQLHALIYVPKIFYQLEDQTEIPVPHYLYNNFNGEFTLNGKLNVIDNFTDYPSLRSTTPRYSNEYCYDNCVIQVLELANAGTLKDLDANEQQLRSLLFQVVECLHELHSNNIIHCDLKADNIMLLETAGKLSAKLTDFDTSIILNKAHAQKLSYIRVQDIFGYADVYDFSFIIIDAYAARYVGETVTTPAISAPETRSFANVFKGKQTDVWQLGYLFLTQFCSNTKNLSLYKGSAEYQIVEQQYSEDLADLISGLTEYNSALRYDMDFVLKHPFFEPGVISLRRFHLNVANAKARKVIIDESQLLVCGEETKLRSNRQLLDFWVGFYIALNSDVKTVFSTAAEQFTLRYTQCQRIENFVYVANQALRQIILTIIENSFGKQHKAYSRTKRSFSGDSLQDGRLMRLIEFFNIADFYSYLTPEICFMLNRNSLLQRNIVEIIDIRDLKHLTKKDIYRAAKVLHYFNLLLRMAAFNIGASYYQVVPTQMQQFQSTFEMDVMRRKQQLARATSVPSKHIEVVQSFANLEAFLGKESTAPQYQNITPVPDLDSDSDGDLPCKYVQPVTSARNSMSVSLPRLHLSPGIPPIPDITLPKATFEHREVALEEIYLPEVSNICSDDSDVKSEQSLARDNNTIVRNDPNFGKAQAPRSPDNLCPICPRETPGQLQSKAYMLNRIKGLVYQHIDFQNISSESSSPRVSGHDGSLGEAAKLAFEPVDWKHLRKDYNGGSMMIECLSSETEEIYLTLSTYPHSKPDADPIAECDAPEDASEMKKLESLFYVTKVEEIGKFVVDGSNYDIGECSDSDSEF